MELQASNEAYVLVDLLGHGIPFLGSNGLRSERQDLRSPIALCVEDRAGLSNAARCKSATTGARADN